MMSPEKQEENIYGKYIQVYRDKISELLFEEQNKERRVLLFSALNFSRASLVTGGPTVTIKNTFTVNTIFAKYHLKLPL
ncbi:MAG: hypothetical protein ABUK01_08920 [Leptospirales bacterium]